MIEGSKFSYINKRRYKCIQRDVNESNSCSKWTRKQEPVDRIEATLILKRTQVLS